MSFIYLISPFNNYKEKYRKNHSHQCSRYYLSVVFVLINQNCFYLHWELTEFQTALSSKIYQSTPFNHPNSLYFISAISSVFSVTGQFSSSHIFTSIQVSAGSCSKVAKSCSWLIIPIFNRVKFSHIDNTYQFFIVFIMIFPDDHNLLNPEDEHISNFLDLSPSKVEVVAPDHKKEQVAHTHPKAKNKTEGKRKKSDGNIVGKKIGHWDREQNTRYHWFLEIYHNHFLKKHLRRIERIFKIMQKFLGTREAEQCRSHHQKMEKRHGNFKTILLHLRRQHYGAQCTQPIYQDLQKNNVELIDGLVEPQELFSEQNQGEKANQDSNMKYEEQVRGMREQGKIVENLMQDGYSKCIDFQGLFP